MEKVKVTKEQAEAIERWADKIQLVKAKLFGFLNHGEDESIAEMTVDELIKALYIGYEVEPEFKVGDWIVANGKTVKLVAETKNTFILDGGTGERNKRIVKEHYRHATPQEIEKEKERRWWAKHGRDVWELREHDILVFEGDSYNVDFIEEGTGRVFFKDALSREFEEVKQRFRVACFAEDRKDVEY